ncbi:MAG: hypothetical protein K2W95_00840 [Candidatus Obscuribacterales bacterium]|nr:hypothetical protein [Candidatus Obscuribacterales bacterium]
MIKRVSPAELRNKQLKERKDAKQDAEALAQERIRALEVLVRHQGYRYLKHIAFGLLEQYRCEPPKRGEDIQQWTTYNSLRWAFERLFNLVEQIAGVSPKAEKVFDDHTGQSDGRIGIPESSCSD